MHGSVFAAGCMREPLDGDRGAAVDASSEAAVLQAIARGRDFAQFLGRPINDAEIHPSDQVDHEDARSLALAVPACGVWDA
jgi:hypothetical protein